MNDECKNCKYLEKYENNGYIILNFVCRECEKGNVDFEVIGGDSDSMHKL